VEGIKVKNNIDDLRKTVEGLQNSLKNDKQEEKPVEKPEENQTKLTCMVQLAKTDKGMPIVDIQGNLIDALGLLKYAKMYLDEEVEKFIVTQKTSIQKEKGGTKNEDS